MNFQIVTGAFDKIGMFGMDCQPNRETWYWNSKIGEARRLPTLQTIVKEGNVNPLILGQTSVNKNVNTESIVHKSSKLSEPFTSLKLIGI